MPKILVITAPTKEKDNAVTLEEVVEPEHFESPHHAAQLIERVGWAVADAKHAEDARASVEDTGASPDEAGASPNAEDLWGLTGPALTEGRAGL